MRHLVIIIATLFAQGGCTKLNDFPHIPDAVYQTLPAPTGMDISYTTIGSIRFNNVSVARISDTLTISTNNGQNGVHIWLKADSLVQDSTYNLDGKSGDIQLYDRNGNVVGSASWMQVEFFQNSAGKVFGNISGTMDNMIQMPNYAQATAYFYNLNLPIKIRK